MQIDYYSREYGICQYDCKPLIGGAFGQDQYALTSLVDKSSGIWEAHYFVLHIASCYPVGKGDTKAAALQDARRVLSGDAKITAAFLAEKADTQKALKAEFEREREERIASFRQERPRQISTRRRRVFNDAGGSCFYCKTTLTLDGDWHIEHRVPRSRGGTDLFDNLTASCVPCNQLKKTKTDAEFLEEQAA